MTRRALSQSSQEPLGAMMRQITRESAAIAQLLADSGFAALAEEVQRLMVVARIGGAVQKARLFRMKGSWWPLGTKESSSLTDVCARKTAMTI